MADIEGPQTLSNPEWVEAVSDEAEDKYPLAQLPVEATDQKAVGGELVVEGNEVSQSYHKPGAAKDGNDDLYAVNVGGDPEPAPELPPQAQDIRNKTPDEAYESKTNIVRP